MSGIVIREVRPRPHSKGGVGVGGSTRGSGLPPGSDPGAVLATLPVGERAFPPLLSLPLVPHTPTRDPPRTITTPHPLGQR